MFGRHFLDVSLINSLRLTDLRFYVPIDTQQVISGSYSQPICWLKFNGTFNTIQVISAPLG